MEAPLTTDRTTQSEEELARLRQLYSHKFQRLDESVRPLLARARIASVVRGLARPCVPSSACARSPRHARATLGPQVVKQ